MNSLGTNTPKTLGLGTKRETMLKKVERYEIQEKLGAGAMASVYKAYDPSIDRHLAIKILHEQLCVDDKYRLRFLREAKAAGNLSHPNIVMVYDVGESESRPYIVMELLEGTPLDELMRSYKKFTLPEIITLGVQLGSALDYAHRRGVVHRDIKPSNIVHSNKGDGVKITDFGIAHIEESDNTHLTRMGDVLGTPQYMSPEQVLGQRADGRSDLFSVVVILYQLVTGQTPFTGNSVPTLMFQIANEEPKPIDKLAPGVPAPLRKIIKKLLQKQPDKRFQTGRELAETLTRALQEIEKKKKIRVRKRVTPIRTKWSFIMTFIVAITMSAGAAVIYHKQAQSMTAKVFDYGVSMVKFVAAETAIAILSEDWVSVELLVQEANDQNAFSYLTVVDHDGVIRGDKLPERVGETYNQDPNEKLVIEKDGVKIYIRKADENLVAYDFDTPVMFQEKEIGRIHLGLPQNSIRNLTDTTLYMMIIFIVATSMVVLIFAYILGNQFTIPVKVLRHSLDEIAAGRLNHRIPLRPKDEFGEVYTSFDRMVDSLQKREQSRIMESRQQEE